MPQTRAQLVVTHLAEGYKEHREDEQRLQYGNCARGHCVRAVEQRDIHIEQIHCNARKHCYGERPIAQELFHNSFCFDRAKVIFIAGLRAGKGYKLFQQAGRASTMSLATSDVSPTFAAARSPAAP